MRKKTIAPVVLALAIVLLAVNGYDADVAAKKIVVEIEDFAITDGKIVEHPEASNGKAVQPLTLDFTAKKTVKIDRAGEYQITLFENAVDGASDALTLQAGSGADARVYPDASNYGKFAPCKKFARFELKEPGDVTIQLFTTNEMGMLLDRIEIELVN
ncbi:MAG: hypothetical protein ACM3ZC_08780 [Bacteroidota bacterium]